mgnify:CR=1 FL=1
MRRRRIPAVPEDGVLRRLRRLVVVVVEGAAFHTSTPPPPRPASSSRRTPQDPGFGYGWHTTALVCPRTWRTEEGQQ